MSVDRCNRARRDVTRRSGLGQGRPRGLHRRRPTGEALDRFIVTHDAAGLDGSWSAGCSRAGVAEVGIERPDGPVVDALLAGRADRAA